MGRGLVGLKFLASLGKALFYISKLKSEKGGARSQDKIDAGGYQRLMATVDFAQTAFGSVTMNCITNRGAGCDYSYAGGSERSFSGTRPPSQEESSAISAATLLTDGAEVVIAPQALPGAQVHFRRP
jgi:hypothetical protein